MTRQHLLYTGGQFSEKNNEVCVRLFLRKTLSSLVWSTKWLKKAILWLRKKAQQCYFVICFVHSGFQAKTFNINNFNYTNETCQTRGFVSAGKFSVYISNLHRKVTFTLFWVSTNSYKNLVFTLNLDLWKINLHWQWC